MGLLLIFLGLLTAGAVADFIVENDLLTKSNDTIVVFGTKLTVSGAAPVVGAFLGGVLTVLLIVIGIGLIRGSWGRRRALKRRITELEWKNTELQSRERLRQVVDATHTPRFVEVPEAAPEPAAAGSGEAQPEPEPEPDSEQAPTPEGIRASS
jgi:hypothetical protein